MHAVKPNWKMKEWIYNDGFYSKKNKDTNRER